MTSTPDLARAFMPGDRVGRSGAPSGPLRGLTFAVKDVIDVQGAITTAGNPTWGREIAPALRSAVVVDRLLDAGAELIGKTVSDEFAYGIMGTNAHFGDPRNPAAPDRFTGGSSCGSAAAVGGASCDFALGTDTGGSVRIPAGCCAISGVRPTHGRVSLDGVLPLAPTFDTVGWLASSPAVLRAVGGVLLGSAETPVARVQRLLIARDADDLLPPGTRVQLDAARERLALRADAVIELAGPAGSLDRLYDAYCTVQGHQAWATYGAWVTEHHGALGPAAAQRFTAARDVDDAAARAATKVLVHYARWLDETLRSGTVLCVATTAGPAPPVASDAATLGEWRQTTMRLTCPASAAGAPQVTLPLADVDGVPFGVSFIGRRGSDESLLQFTAGIADRAGGAA